ncbi:hypothetical protein [Streptomyces sp. SCL15-6]|uniref:hypothetical protein n=1 Tax=Streptomyces sp. SCL15-6 TaxID=2967222 RepID=UPI002966CD49|nr:hypothetical protein [Streptomyces sp. SCL15-6]
MDRRVLRFQHLAQQVPAVCAQLDLPERERADVAAYMRVMTPWMSGYHTCQAAIQRHDAPRVVPPSRPGHLDEVLRSGARRPRR